MSLSDLELVAKAMEPTNQAAPPGQAAKESAEVKALAAKSNLQQGSASKGDLQPQSASTGPPSDAKLPTRSAAPVNGNGLNGIDIPGIDPSLLANLSAADLASLQPLINALSIDPDAAEEEEDLDELDQNDPRIQELLRQMDVAGDVADDLEGKLDKLIAALGEEEVNMEQAVESINEGKQAEEGAEK